MYVCAGECACFHKIIAFSSNNTYLTGNVSLLNKNTNFTHKHHIPFHYLIAVGSRVAAVHLSPQYDNLSSQRLSSSTEAQCKASAELQSCKKQPSRSRDTLALCLLCHLVRWCVWDMRRKKAQSLVRAGPGDPSLGVQRKLVCLLLPVTNPA